MPEDSKSTVKTPVQPPTYAAQAGQAQQPGPTKAEQIAALVERLAGQVQDIQRNIPGHSLTGDMAAYSAWLAEAHRYFREATNQELTLTYASEWLLDNYYIVRQALNEISEDLPESYYRQLPKLVSGPLKGYPRIYAVTNAVLSFQHLLLNMDDLQTILSDLQERVPLTMGELWAAPIFLRYGLIEGLGQSLERIIRPKNPPNLPGSAPRVPASESTPTETRAGDSNIVANAILSLRAASEQNWNNFFEAVSRVERTLRRDPAGVYQRMDFKSRDLYRKEVEELAFATGQEENTLAETAIALARAAAGSDGHLDLLADRRAHVGYYLLGEGRAELEQQIHYHPSGLQALKRWVLRPHNASIVYLSGILILAALLTLLVWLLSQPSGPGLYRWVAWAIAPLLLLIPALTVSNGLANWLVTLLLPPRILPKIEFRDEVPAPFHTLVVIPALITNSTEVDSLAGQLEMHYLRNPEPGLFFALLTDFGDAPQETLPEDEALVEQAAVEIRMLNEKYARPDGTRPFYFFHRPRRWNAGEGNWMGWERKRGKLRELNELLLGHDHPHFLTQVGDLAALRGKNPVRFVITLDADTILPRGSAARLVGTLAHPLNQAQFDEKTGKVTAGYTVLQPRMEISPISANHSWFTRIFAGDTGLDLYSRAVSDAYQDLFGEGSYVGKGIYDVAAFERSIDESIPENKLLSHDLLEGLLGRAGLVSDVTMVEDYPPNYFVQSLRLRRWIRGDWQLLPWLFTPEKYGVHFSAVGRWKIMDNLRRSLLAPVLMILFLLGLLVLRGPAWLWTAVVLIAPGVPLLTSLARGSVQALTGEPVAGLRPVGWDLLRWLLAITFLPYEAYLAVDAIAITLYRMLVSRRNLLQWTSSAHTERLFSHQHYAWLKLSAAALLALMIAGALLLFHRPDALPAAAPLLILWAVSPLVVRWINQPLREQVQRLNAAQTELLRQVARRTWAFFERYVGPEDHWLPPDHFQESPVGIVAHRTSPTNIGLLLTSTLAAFDLGYLDQLGLVTRLTATFDTLTQMERHRGHFLNWYDTLTLHPLTPRYVSTVDSGNLAACFIVTAQAATQMQNQPIFRWELWLGYLDILSILSETLKLLRKSEETTGQAPDDQVEAIQNHIADMRARILAAQTTPDQWYGLFQAVSGPFWQDISNHLVNLIEAGQSAFNLETLRGLRDVANQVERHHMSIQRTIQELTPWIPLLENPPADLGDPDCQPILEQLRAVLPYSPTLPYIHDLANEARQVIAALKQSGTNTPRSDSQPGTEAAAESASSEGLVLTDSISLWLDSLEQGLARAERTAALLLHGYAQIIDQAEKMLSEIDFRFLYNPQRRIFHIGYNLDSGQLDANYYDLLASEARIASLIAIALDQVSQSHWLHLSRPVTEVERLRVLLSWSATMFEYLMPPLFLRTYPGTLLAESARGAVIHQIAYGKSRGVPWGISESGFYRFDANQNYQYRAFGVPGLGFKRGLGDDLVIAPYASLMAVNYNPQAVIHNINELAGLNAVGTYGFYEAVDFTADRLLIGETSAIVREYMSHHQGMILLALVNYFKNDVMIRRMHDDPRIQSIDLLLQEQVPLAAPVQSPYAEDVKGVQRLDAAAARVSAWPVPVQTPIPEVHLLSNGTYSVIISNTGSGYSAWRDTDLTRWQPDQVLDSWGTWVYIEEDAEDKLWSATYQPIPGDHRDVQVTFHAHMAVFRRTENGIITTQEVTVPPDDPIELRRVHLTNTTDRTRRLRLTSYGEVILAQQAVDARHPAFNKLFIEGEFLPEQNLQIYHRRQRSPEETPLYMAHMLVISGSRPVTGAHEADRAQFIGRDRTPRDPLALSAPGYLSGSTGATLDPIFSLGQEIELGPHESAEIAYLTFAGDDRAELLSLAERYRSWTTIERAYHQADLAAQAWLGRNNLDTDGLQNILQVLSGLIYPFQPLRADPETLQANSLGQPGLWRFGISGDYPILVVELDDPAQVDLAREALQAHRYLRARRYMADLVILNKQQTNYGAELNGMLYRLISRVNSEQWLNQRGGIFILLADQMHPDERTLLLTAARVLLRGERGGMGAQLPGYSLPIQHLPDFVATETAAAEPAAQEAGPPVELSFFNGYGGFSADGREYIIEWSPDHPTPAPWVNIIGYAHFGFLVTEAGSQTTWAINSGENRLTPWSNDPIRDPSGETLYLRDEETGEVWTPTPLPGGADAPYRITHGAGYTIFRHTSHGLEQRMMVFASPEDPVKIVHLEIKNTRDRPRRITATQYVEWVLGVTHAANMPYILPEYDPERECLLATNPYNTEFRERVAFLAACKQVHGLTADRAEFLGRNGSPGFPAALRRIGLERRIAPGEDPCAVLQLHIDLSPNGSDEIYFVIGQGDQRDHALALVDKYHDPAYVGAALERTRALWDHLLDAVQVKTPDLAVDYILNRWLLYQALSCRVWGRTAFYQSSGAFGFRDQLQDVLAVLPSSPAIARGQILNAAHHQFEAGDVLHWWHPPSGRGVRTRFSDDLLWLPYVTALYLEATNDTAILDEQIPFLHAPPLKEDEDERYGLYDQTEEKYSLFEHCRRAIEKGATSGPHGLPLIGTGDWNDGFNRVGSQGRGESIWLAWFLIDVLNRFAAVCEQRGDAETARGYRDRAQQYAAHIEQSAWDGAWYRRAYYDDGAPLGSNLDPECKIDSIAQSWAVLANAGQPERVSQAMRSLVERLVLRDNRLILLFTPPFDKTPRNPGYIKGYLPGTRENGGQYTHAATWAAWAFTRLGDGKQSGELYNLLNPVYQAASAEGAAVYRVEPYVICADIYSVQPYLRRGGWTWYTGSAAWMYRLGLEAVLGLQKVGDHLRIDPVIPPEWDGFEINYRHGQAVYHIYVTNPDHAPRGVRVVHLDGKELTDQLIPLNDDGQNHQVEIIMGAT